MHALHVQVRLELGGKLELGPFGGLDFYGIIQANPPYFYVSASFCKSLFGFMTSGSAFIDSSTMTMGFEAQMVLGFFGQVEVGGVRAMTPSPPPAHPPLSLSLVHALPVVSLLLQRLTAHVRRVCVWWLSGVHRVDEKFKAVLLRPPEGLREDRRTE